MSDTLAVPTGPTDADRDLARKAVERGWASLADVETALAKGGDFLTTLKLTEEQLRELRAVRAPVRTEPSEVTAAASDPSRRAGRYVLLGLLGQGGMGSVYRAWDAELRRYVAVKYLKQIADETARAFFRREATVAAGLDHPNIAKVHEVGEHGGVPFIAMQFVDGDTAARAARDMTLARKVDVVRCVAEAIRYAHGKGVVHRDLKPANVMIERNGHVYVMDFGLAKESEVDGRSLTQTGSIVGTPQYMAPEQARGKADAQSDVYSMGAILYEFLTGRPPFQGETPAEVLVQVLDGDVLWPRKLVPTLPADVEAITIRALEKDRRRRYAHAGQLLEDLEAYAKGEPLVHARRPTWAYVLGKRIRKRPLQWAFGAAMVAALAAGGAFGISQLLKARRSDLEKLRVEREEQRKTAEALRQAEARERDARRSLAAARRTRCLQRLEANDGAGAVTYADAAFRAWPDRLGSALLRGLLARLPRLTFAADTPLLQLAGRTAVELDGGTIRVRDVDRGSVLFEVPTEYTISHLQLSPDGAWLAICFGSTAETRPWSHPRLEIRNARTGAVRLAPRTLSAPAKEARFSIDGSRLWIRSGAGHEIRSAETGERIGVGLPGEIVTYGLSPDLRRIWSYESGGILRCRNLETGSIEAEKTLGNQSASRIVVSPGGGHLLVGTSTGLRVFDGGLRELGRIGKQTAPTLFAFEPSGSTFVYADEEGVLHRHSIEKPEQALRSLSMRAGPLVLLSLSADGRRIAVQGKNGTIQVQDQRGVPFALPLRLPAPASSLTFSPDGSRLAAVGSDGRLRIWSLPPSMPDGERSLTVSSDGDLGFTKEGRLLTATGEERLRLRGSWRLAAFSSDDRFLVAVGDSGELTILEVRSGQARASSVRLQPSSWPFFLEGADRVLVTTAPRVLEILDTATAASIARIEMRRDLDGAGSSRTGRLLLIAGAESRVVDAVSGRVLANLSGEFSSGAISPDGRRIVVSTPEETRLLDGDGRELCVLNARGERRTGWKFSPDGQCFYPTGLARTPLYDAETGTPRPRALVHDDAVRELFFSPDGRRILSSSGSVCRLWDRETLMPVGRKMAHGDQPVMQGGWSPDGRWVVTWTTELLLRFWDGESGEYAGVEFGCFYPVDLIFAKDGSRLVVRNPKRGGEVLSLDVLRLEGPPEDVLPVTGLRLNGSEELEPVEGGS